MFLKEKVSVVGGVEGEGCGSGGSQRPPPPHYCTDDCNKWHPEMVTLESKWP